MKKFVFLEHTADAKFQAFGKTIEECFANAGLAVNAVEAEIGKVKPREKLEIKVSADSQEALLHRFLEEVLFQMETREMLFSKIKVKINEGKNSLAAELFGEKIDGKRHELKTLAKAVTWNGFYLKKEKGVWTAQVVCDT